MAKKLVLASLLLGYVIWGFGIVAANEETSENLLHIENSVPCESNYSHPTGEFKQNGTLSANQECVMNFLPENSTEIFIFFKHLYLAEDDNVTIYQYDKNESVFPPFHGQNDGIVVATGEKNLTIILRTSARNDLVRKFSGFYQSQACSIPIPDDVPSVLSPLYKQNSADFECEYNYYEPRNYSYYFVFSDFNLNSDSSLEVKGSDLQDGSYKNIPPDIFSQKQTTFTINLKNNIANQTFRITRRDVHQDCTGYIKLKGSDPPHVLKSPLALKVRNTSAPTECCWLIHNEDGQGAIGLTLSKLEFESVFDLLSIGDGQTELSKPLLQVTISNRNDSGQIIRSSGNFMWISFKPLNFDSNFSANVTVHGQGGYYSGNGTITMNPTTGQDTIFLLEVDESERVLLNFTSSNFKPPATISIYEDFGIKTKPTIQVHDNVWYPIISQTSKMMIIGTNFSTGTFAAKFSGIISDCMHTSRSESDTYILSGNCNNICYWVIAPKESSEEELLLNIQYLALDINDKIVISHLNNNTVVATITSAISHVPEISLRASDGGVFSVQRGNCTRKPNDVILIAHSNYIPGCSGNIQLKSSEMIQIKSPGYPNTYPLLAECTWNVELPSKTNFLHLSFNSLQLAPNHYVRIISLKDKNPINNTYRGNQLPEDLLLNDNAVIQFDSSAYNETKTGVALVSDEGFVINATLAECGGIMNSSTGQFSTSDYPKPFTNGSLCIWKVQVPPGEQHVSANIIAFSIVKDKTENYELKVYDGASVRDKTANITGSEIWSHTNTLYFVYKRLNTSLPSTALNITYRMISCNKSMLCNNGICLHPDWRCDGKNDCGDFTDEKDCGSVPIPPTPKPIEQPSGYSPLTLGLVIPFCLIIGALLMFIVPRFVNRYRGGNYHQFRDISSAE